MTYYGYIYKITIPTSKGDRFYIGKRVSPIIQSYYWGSGIKIQKWVQKHTHKQFVSNNLPEEIAKKLNLKREILYWAKDEIDLCQKEFEFTKDILNNKLFWNLRVGGDRIGISEETRKRMSKARKGKPGWNKGLTKETDERIKLKAERQTGIPLSEEHRKSLCKPKSVPNYRKNKTYEEVYGIEKAKALKESFSKTRKGKKQSKALIEKRSKSLKGLLWWNNGKLCTRSKTCPGKDWVKGQLRKRTIKGINNAPI